MTESKESPDTPEAVEGQETPVSEPILEQPPKPLNPEGKDLPPMGIDADAKVTLKVEWPDGRVDESELLRNRVVILDKLATLVSPNPENKEELEAIKVSATLPAKTIPQSPDEEPQDAVITWAKGNASEAFMQLASNVIMPQEAVVGLTRFLQDIEERSDLCGVMVTTVFKDAGVGGFTMLSDLIDIDTAQYIQLAEAAAGQVEQYKEQMRGKGVTFPDDSNIIIPGQENKAPAAPFRLINGPEG